MPLKTKELIKKLNPVCCGMGHVAEKNENLQAAVEPGLRQEMTFQISPEQAPAGGPRSARSTRFPDCWYWHRIEPRIRLYPA